jgi:hypothetical protein
MSVETAHFPAIAYPEALPGDSEAIAQHRARIQELTTPTDETMVAFEAQLATAANDLGRQTDLGQAEKADIPTVVDGVRWLAAGKPGEPVPDMCYAYTSTIGYPVLGWRHEMSGDMIRALLDGTRSARLQMYSDVKGRSGEIKHELAGVIELSPAYRLCEELLAADPGATTKPELWRYAEVSQRIVGSYGLALSGLKNNPGALRGYNRGVHLVELGEGSTPSSAGQRDAAVDRARAYFAPLLEGAYKREYPGQPLPEDLFDFSTQYMNKIGLLLDVACQINGSNEGCSAANDFLRGVITAVFSDNRTSLLDIMYAQKEAAAYNAADCFANMPLHGNYGGSWLRWWLKELDYPPVQDFPSVGAVEPARRPERSVPRSEIEQMKDIRIGDVLIDGRPEATDSTRRLIVDVPRQSVLPTPREGFIPSLRIRFTPEVSARYETEMPLIPGYITTAEVVGPDNGRTFDFVRSHIEDPYDFCAEPLGARSIATIGFYQGLGATRMAASLAGAKSPLRIGDIGYTMGLASRYIAEGQGGMDIPPISVRHGYLQIQCDAAAWLVHDGLVAGGVPKESLRVLNGYVLPAKGMPLTAARHASVEYTDKQYDRFILDPPIIMDRGPSAVVQQGVASQASRRNGLMSRFVRLARPEVQLPDGVEAPIPAGQVMLAEHDAAADLVSVMNPVGKPHNQAETVDLTAPAPGEPRAEIAAPTAAERTKQTFERLLAKSLGLGAPNRPATSMQVWQHIAAHCRRPGDVVAMTAAVVDSASTADFEALTPGDVKARLDDIDLITELIQAANAGQNGMRTRTGGYDAGTHNALLHTLQNLKGLYGTQSTQAQD